MKNMTTRMQPSTGYEPIPDPSVEQEELTDRDMLIINSIKLQNKIREISKGVSDDGFDTREVSPETIDQLGVLTLRLKENLEELDLDEQVEKCNTAMTSLARAKENINDIQRTKPMEKMDHELYLGLTWGLKNEIQGLYVFSLGEVASEL